MTEAQHLAFRVVEYALKTLSSSEISTTSLVQTSASDGSQILDIPRLCDYEGRALYLDASVLPLRNVEGLLTAPLNTGALVDAGRFGFSSSTFGVLLFDCARARWKNSRLELDTRRLPPEWRARKAFLRRRPAFLNYADPLRQPWTSVRTSYAKLWCHLLMQAVQNGAVTRDELKEEIRHGCVRPSLLHQVDELIEDPRLLPKHVTRRDESFVPPRARYTHLGTMALLSRSYGWRGLLAPLSRALSAKA